MPGCMTGRRQWSIGWRRGPRIKQGMRFGVRFGGRNGGRVSSGHGSGHAGRRGICARADAAARGGFGAGRVSEGSASSYDVFSRFVGRGEGASDCAQQSERERRVRRAYQMRKKVTPDLRWSLIHGH